MSDDFARLSLKQKIFLTTDGTVTDLIALFSGETIRISKLNQEVLLSDQPRRLALPAPARLLKRVVLLSGAARHYLYAESFFVIERMSAELQQQLLHTDTPIGLLWKEARLEMFRELIDRGVESRPDLVRYFPDADDDLFLSRCYLVHHGQKPVGMITEKMPLSYFRDN
ncbi:chorismate--pyruvate lyase family protein [Gilvimarinus sp. F26214L]|uniref:chorismate--pyruvate lyase family protein n=1 Tax=Gilvimarinus sp. DZF01 TaxID=3461371 RepID=UPI004045FB8D